MGGGGGGARGSQKIFFQKNKLKNLLGGGFPLF